MIRLKIQMKKMKLEHFKYLWIEYMHKKNKILRKFLKENSKEEMEKYQIQI